MTDFAIAFGGVFLFIGMVVCVCVLAVTFS
jgi:hypothetical protein